VVPSPGDIVWHSTQEQQIYREDVCGWHLFRLKGKGLHYPLGHCESLEVIGHRFQQHLQRTETVRQARMRAAATFRPTFTYTSTTMTGGYYFQ
jgi:hypothetical protein